MLIEIFSLASLFIILHAAILAYCVLCIGVLAIQICTIVLLYIYQIVLIIKL